MFIYETMRVHDYLLNNSNKVQYRDLLLFELLFGTGLLFGTVDKRVHKLKGTPRPNFQKSVYLSKKSLVTLKYAKRNII